MFNFDRQNRYSLKKEIVKKPKIVQCESSLSDCGVSGKHVSCEESVIDPPRFELIVRMALRKVSIDRYLVSEGLWAAELAHEDATIEGQHGIFAPFNLGINTSFLMLRHIPHRCVTCVAEDQFRVIRKDLVDNPHFLPEPMPDGLLWQLDHA